MPDIALPVADGEELGGDRLERLRLVVLRVDLEQLEVDLLPLRILLQRILQDLLGLRVAAVREVDLGLGDRIDLVGVDVAETFAAEVARERVVAGVDHAAAGRAEDGVRLDVGAGDDAVLELRALAATRGDQRGDAAEDCERRGTDRPVRRRREEVGEEARRLGLSAPARPSVGALAASWRRRAAARPPARLRPWVPSPGPAASRCSSGESRRRLPSRPSRRRARGAAAPVPARPCRARRPPAPAAAPATGCLSSSARCISAIVFSSAAIRVCASLSCWSRAIASSAAAPRLAGAGLARHAQLVRPGRRRRRAVLDRGADASARLRARRRRPTPAPRPRRGRDSCASRTPAPGRSRAASGRRRRLRVRGRRDRHDRAGAQPVHVVAFERRLVAAEQRRRASARA